MSEEAQRKMHRSPNHPFFDLADAVAKVKTVYDKEKRSATAPEVIVKHLGYNALNGPGGRTLSGLRQFGLLEESSGRYKISDDAFALTQYSKESEQWKKAVRRAALTPTLYRELHAEFPDLSASDETLRVALLDRGFNPDVIERVLHHFRLTMEFAGIPDGSYNDPEGENKMETPPTAANDALKPPTVIPPANLPVGKTYTYGFEGEGNAVLTISGPYTSEDLDDLEASIQTSLKTLRRSVKKDVVQ